MKTKGQTQYPGYMTKLAIFTIDATFALISFCFAKLLIENFDFYPAFAYWQTGVLLLLLRMGSFSVFRTHHLILRYTGEKDYRNVFYAVTLSSLLFTMVIFLVPGVNLGKNAVGVIMVDYALMLLFSGGFRILLRLLFDRLRLQQTSRLNTVIFGAGEMGAMLQQVLRTNGSHDYKAVAFFDDNQQVHNKLLNGIQIFDPEKSFAQIVRKYDIKVAIIAINRLSEERRIRFINACLDYKVKVLKIPSTESWINGTLNLSQLRDINFEDLLNRPPIKLDLARIRSGVRGKVILVTGCAGSIGSEIVRQLLHYRPKMVIGLDQAETPLAEITLALKESVKEGIFQTIIGDVKDYDKMYRLFKEYRPDYVFHAAAYKHVPIMERFPDEAIKANIMGTKNIADLSVEFKVRKFIMISTDKVVNPGNVMGASKRIAEIYVQSLNYSQRNAGTVQFITTRFGNVLGSNGSVIPIFKSQIEKRQDLTVTHPEVTRYFMTIPEACQLVLEASAMGKGGEIFIFDMGKPVRIYDLARKMIQMAGLTLGKDIDIVFCGLRPGEKLNEELLDHQEDIIETHHPKIKKARVRPYEYQKIKFLIDELIQFAIAGLSYETLVGRMKEIVPEFASQNSIYAALDDKSAVQKVAK